MNIVTRRSAFPALEPAGPALSLFEDALNHFLRETPTARPWSPAVDIAENENELLLTADVPGVKMEDVEIKLEDGTLTVAGHREFEQQNERGGYHRIERSYGAFQRAFSLPESVELDKVSASYENGVLTVHLPKKEVAKPKTIKVAVGNRN